MSPGPEVLLVLAAAYLSGIVNATVGGGGLIQLTGLLATFPQAAHPVLLGTNKLASIVGTGVAVARYAQGVAIPWRIVLPACAIASWAALPARRPSRASRTICSARSCR